MNSSFREGWRAALAGFAVWQLGAISTQVTKMTGLSETTMRVLQIETELQAMRRAVLRYVFDRDKPSFADYCAPWPSSLSFLPRPSSALLSVSCSRPTAPSINSSAGSEPARTMPGLAIRRRR